MKRIPCFLSLIMVLTCSAVHAQTSLYHFDNGFSLSTSESNESGLVGMSILVYGGTQFEERGERGTFRLLLDTLQRGTRNRTVDEISFEVSQLGDSFDAYAAADYWAIEATVAPEGVYQLLELVYDLMQHPLFSEEELQKSRNIAVQTIRTMEDAPLHVGFDFFRSVFYPDFYASPEERIRNIKNVRREQLLEIHQRYFTPGNMVMSLSGALDTDEVFRLVSQTFGSVPARFPAPQKEKIRPIVLLGI
jgi:predicted Zn-dependent peptidase